jgi:hypothetical protein
MAQQIRVQQLYELLTQLGFLVDPIRRLIESDDSVVHKRLPYIRSQFQKELAIYRGAISEFVQFGDLNFSHEFSAVSSLLHQLGECAEMCQYPEHIEDAKRRFPELLAETQKALAAIPHDDPDVILPALSPFTTYLRLRATCATASRHLELFDAYLDDTVFHRYLADVPAAVQIVVVTNNKRMEGHKAQFGKAIVAISELFAIERPMTYRFVIDRTNQIHDRHLRVDNEVLHLGGSPKDASRKSPFTIGKLNRATQDQLDNAIARSEEWFGPNTTSHKQA